MTNCFSTKLQVEFCVCDLAWDDFGFHIANRDGTPRGGDNLTIEDRDDALEWSCPPKLGISPAHSLWPGKAHEDVDDDPSQDVLCLKTNLLNIRKPELALAGVALLALVEACQTGAFQESPDRLIRRTDARAALLFRHVRLRQGQPVDNESQPPRRGIGCRARELEARLLQLLRHKTLEIL